MAFARGALPRPPARVLEVGAGRGELAAVLRDDGWDVRAIDPKAEDPGVEPVALAELEAPPGSFDAVLAVVSLHHVEPLEESVAVLAATVRPGGALVVDEIDVARLDERAAAWWLERQVDVGKGEGHRFGDDPASLVAGMREHVHDLDTVRAALARWFDFGAVERLPYLHRWHLPPGFRDAEVALIEAGELSPMGARFIGVRRAD
ncbi:MAG TPA: methyltransferase domain-containing protein [Solirubrobacteraceae bacterium]